MTLYFQSEKPCFFRRGKGDLAVILVSGEIAACIWLPQEQIAAHIRQHGQIGYKFKRSGRKVKPLDPVCMLPLGGFPIRMNVWYCW